MLMVEPQDMARPELVQRGPREKVAQLLAASTLEVGAMMLVCHWCRGSQCQGSGVARCCWGTRSATAANPGMRAACLSCVCTQLCCGITRSCHHTTACSACDADGSNDHANLLSLLLSPASPCCSCPAPSARSMSLSCCAFPSATVSPRPASRHPPTATDIHVVRLPAPPAGAMSFPHWWR
jgi:hypothetical protein